MCQNGWTYRRNSFTVTVSASLYSSVLPTGSLLIFTLNYTGTCTAYRWDIEIWESAEDVLLISPWRQLITRDRSLWKPMIQCCEHVNSISQYDVWLNATQTTCICDVSHGVISDSWSSCYDCYTPRLLHKSVIF